MDKKTDRLIHLVKQVQEQFAEQNLVLPVPGFISRKFLAYAAMKEDFEMVLHYLEELKKSPDGYIKSALSYALIALYGKCFTEASKSSSTKLEPAELFNGREDDHIMHDHLMDMQHRFIAHRGETENEIGMAYMLVPKKESLDKIQIGSSQIKMTGLSSEDLLKIETLVRYLLSWISEKLQKSNRKVQEGMLSLYSPEQLIALSKAK